MPDDFDVATEQRDALLANQIQNHRLQNAKRTCLPVGICYNCEASVPEGVSFCDSDCRDDHQRRNYHAKINAR